MSIWIWLIIIAVIFGFGIAGFIAVAASGIGNSSWKDTIFAGFCIGVIIFLIEAGIYWIVSLF